MHEVGIIVIVQTSEILFIVVNQREALVQITVVEIVLGVVAVVGGRKILVIVSI